MKNIVLFCTLLTSSFLQLQAQIKIGGVAGAPPSSAVLELDGGTNRGLLLPRMTLQNMNNIQNPAAGLTIYATDEQAMYLRRSNKWVKMNGNEDIISLPYYKQFAFTEPLLILQNFGENAGDGIWGISTHATGVQGQTNAGIGVKGVAQFFNGIPGYFENTYNIGRSLISMNRTGIGTENPACILHVDATKDNASEAITVNDDALVTVQLQNDGIKKGYLQADVNNMVLATNFSNNTGKVALRTNNIDRILVNPDGRIIINSAAGTSPAGAQFLKVRGGIQATDFTVTTLASWPDYVFADDYKLKSLEETEAFIKANRHLPNIPSATVVDKEGFALGDMQKRMMEKIEELTLHLIEANKALKEFRSASTREIEELKQQVQALQAKK
ncbi:MAG: hypothetical protein EAY75_09220 [Bacteroidetes bacterium]|nr:MAG: hypothetical protein EAY75_09220 [Bacteroidota bacterium]